MNQTLAIPMGLVLPHVQRIDTFFQTLSVPLQATEMHHHIYEALAEYLYNRLCNPCDTDVSEILNAKLAGESISPARWFDAHQYVHQQFDVVYATLRGTCQELLNRLQVHGQDIDYLYFAFPVSHDTLFLVFETTPIDEVMHVPIAAVNALR